MKKKRIIFFVKIAVSLFFVFWIIFRINWSESFEHLRQAKIWYLMAYLSLILIGVAISAHKWKILAQYKNINLPYAYYFKLYLVGMFINNFMPSFVAGDFYRSYQTGKKANKYVEATSAVVMDRISGLLGLMMLAFIFSLFNFKTVSEHKILLFMNSVVAIIFFLCAVLPVIERYMRVKRLVEKILPSLATKTVGEIYRYKESKKIFSKSIGYSLVFNFVGVALANFVLFNALSIEVKILDYLSVIFFISIISSVPITVNNIGLKEWAYITLLGLFGLNSSAVVIIAILSRFLQMILSFVAIPIYLKEKKSFSLRDTAR